jgi:HK97 family phage major capsid protein
MNDATFLHIQTMKDGEGNYIWQPGLTLDAPDVLIGKKVVIEDNLADIGSGAFPIYFGNWKRAYTIVDRFGIRVLRDPYTNKPYIMFYTTKRVGGGILMYEALKALKTS